MGVNARKSDYLTVGFANAFTEKLIPFPESSWETFRNFAPNGKVPCLHHDDLIVWDSLAIVEYLAEHHSGIWPVDRIARAWARSVTSEFTAVDAFFCPIAFRAQTYNLPLHDPYIQQLLSLKSMQAWEAAAIQETWRDPEHERESLAAGLVLLDRRQSIGSEE